MADKIELSNDLHGISYWDIDFNQSFENCFGKIEDELQEFMVDSKLSFVDGFKIDNPVQHASVMCWCYNIPVEQARVFINRLTGDKVDRQELINIYELFGGKFKEHLSCE